MAGLNLRPDGRGQVAAIVRARWQTFVHSLRTVRGRVEVVSRGFIALIFAVFAIGGAFGMAAAAWTFVRQGKLDWLVLLLWPVFLFWQFFPVMTTAFAQTIDSSDLLRFPLSYRLYFLVRLVYGSLDPGTALGGAWLLGIAAGIGLAAPRLLPWAALVLLTFALVNILLSRMIFAWIERWLARRRTREILGILFFLIIVGIQFIEPLTERYGRRVGPGVMRHAQQVSSLQRPFPPALAADAIARPSAGQFSTGVLAFVLLALWGTAFLWLLNFRLRAQYRGENLSEVIAPKTAVGKSQVRPGWNMLGLPPPIAAVVEKELRYLSRSGPMLLTLVMPALMLVIILLQSGSHGSFLKRAPDYAFPVGAAYALLILTNIVYNSFGADSGGIQLLFAAPVRFRQVVIGKNLAHAAIFAVEMVLVWATAGLMTRPPSLAVTVVTLAAVFFAAPLDLAIGNLLSVYYPTKVELGRFGRQRASQTTVLVSFASRILLFGVAVLIILVARRYGSLWLAAPIFLVLGGLGFLVYARVLNVVERTANLRRETIIAEVSRT